MDHSYSESGAAPRPDVAQIEELLRDLVGRDDTSESLMRERLEAARFYLVGSMPSEYAMNLKLAEEVLPDIKDKDLHSRLDTFLRSQHPSTS
jgi:hypothetical protein